MVLKDEAVPHHVNAHFLEVGVAEQRRQLSRDLVLLDGFEIGPETSLSKEHSELLGIPGLVSG